jgi:hypothetical protein
VQRRYAAYNRFSCADTQDVSMAINTDRIDDCVLALLLLGRHDGQRVWKSFDWGRDGSTA